jgi:predicted porin
MIKRASISTAVILAFAGTSAHADVTLYGKVDLGVVQESGGTAGSVIKLSSGALAPSRLGVKADFDLGDGLKAKGQFETGVCADSNNNPAGQYCTGGNFMGRRATLGLVGSFGEVSLGRQFTPAYLNIDNFDPFGTGTAGQATNLFHAVFRANNSIVYSAPTWNGVSASAMYAFGEVQGNNTANRQIGASLGYVQGPLSLGAAYNEQRAADSSATKDGNLGASYDFGVATLNALFQRTTGKNQYLIGTTVPAAGGTIMASYVRATDRTAAGNDASQVGVGYTKPINKMLKGYVAYAHISNKNGAAYTVGNATDDGSGTSALNLGLVLSF